MKKFYASIWLFSLLALFIPCPAICDDTLLDIYGGTAKMMSDKTPDIIMSSETVTIELGVNNYTVDANFVFFNSGKEAKVPVGFPKIEGSGGKLEEFQTWVNGKQTDFKELPTGTQPENEPGMQWQATEWMVKEVTFPAGKKTVTRVKYRASYGIAPVGGGIGPWMTYLDYVYGTGRSWKGNIGNAIFIIKTSPQAWIYYAKFGKGSAPAINDNARAHSFKRLSEYEFQYSLQNFEPEADELFTIAVGEDKFRLDIFWPQECATCRSNLCWSGPEADDQWYSTEVIPDQMLEMLSPWQLRVLRNYFYAYHGKVFESAELQQYFNEVDCYKPTPNFKESDLNDIEQANVQKISDYEKKLAELSAKKPPESSDNKPQPQTFWEKLKSYIPWGNR